MTYPIIATTTTGRRVQLPIHPTLADQSVGLFGSQNLTESSKIGVHEISKVNLGGTTTVTTQTTRLLNPIGNNEQQHYPTSEFESSNSLDDQCVTEISSIELSDQGGRIEASTGEITKPKDAENVVPEIENQIQSTTKFMENPDNGLSNPPIDTLNALTQDTPLLDDHRMTTSSSLELSDQTGTIGVSTGEITNLAHTENVLPDIENQIQFTTRNMENPDNDAAILDAALLHGYPSPTTCAVFVTAYATVAAVGATKYIDKKYSPFDTHFPYMIISIVAYLMAMLVLAILFCLYARLSRPSTQQVFAELYKTLTYIYGFLMILATLCVVATLFTQKTVDLVCSLSCS